MLCVPHVHLLSWGQNGRFSHSFHTEDFVGKLTNALCTTQMNGMEEAGLVRWYTGFLGQIDAHEVKHLKDHFIVFWDCMNHITQFAQAHCREPCFCLWHCTLSTQTYSLDLRFRLWSKKRLLYGEMWLGWGENASSWNIYKSNSLWAMVLGQ